MPRTLPEVSLPPLHPLIQGQGEKPGAHGHSHPVTVDWPSQVPAPATPGSSHLSQGEMQEVKTSPTERNDVIEVMQTRFTHQDENPGLDSHTSTPSAPAFYHQNPTELGQTEPCLRSQSWKVAGPGFAPGPSSAALYHADSGLSHSRDSSPMCRRAFRGNTHHVTPPLFIKPV